MTGTLKRFQGSCLNSLTSAIQGGTRFNMAMSFSFLCLNSLTSAIQGGTSPSVSKGHERVQCLNSLTSAIQGGTRPEYFVLKSDEMSQFSNECDSRWDLTPAVRYGIFCGMSQFSNECDSRWDQNTKFFWFKHGRVSIL